MEKYRFRAARPASAIWLVTALASACSGSIEPGARSSSGSGPPPPPGGDPRGGAAAPSLPPPAQAMFKPGPASLRRLTQPQYANSIRDLLGEDVNVPGGFEADTVLSGFASIGAALTTVSSSAAEKYEAAAMTIAEQVLGDPARRSRVVGCTPAGPGDEACARSFMASFGRRAWRRPLSTEEIDRYVALAKQAGTSLNDGWKGLTYALAGVLQSPNFLYRVELGTAVPGMANVRAFDDWELATRLSFFLWNTTPDDALLDAAQNKKLTAGGLRQQALRLLDSPRARVAVKAFFHELLRLDGTEDLEQSPANFKEVTATLGAAMREETLRFLEDVVLSPAGDFRQAFDAPSTFVNKELATLYGLPAPAGTDFQKVALPDDGLRLGLLGQSSFLALNAHETTTSPTRRGKFVRESVLCHEIPAPPPDVDASLPPDPPGGGPRTMRERLAVHNGPTCTPCHERMDPIGLAFENFDAIGKFRSQDAGKPIDASGDIDGVTFKGPRELGAVLRAHPDLETCLVRSVYRYAMGHIETADQEVLIKHIASNLPQEQRWKSLLLDMVDSPGFRTAADGN